MTNTIILNQDEKDVVCKVLTSKVVVDLVGAEQWDLTDDEEVTLWDVIVRARQSWIK